MAEFPALPLWTDALLGDTTHLNTLEFGAYMKLLIASWRTPKCDLPFDDKLIARYAGLSPAQWKGMRSIILQFFTKKWRFGEWRLHQKRLRKERKYVLQRSIVQSKRAKARWLKNNKTRNAEAMPETCHPTPTPIIKETSEAKASSSKKKSTPPKRASQIPEDWKPDTAAKEYGIKCGMPDWSVVEIEAERFVNHHRAKGNVFKDHQAAWRTWCRNYPEFNNRGANGRRQDEPYVNPHAQLVTEWVRELDQIPDDRDDTTQGGDPGEPERKAIALH